MKKWFLAILCVCLAMSALAFTGCKEKEKPTSTDKDWTGFY